MAIQEITPRSPISMGGYGQRAGLLSSGIHDPLFTKALFLKQGGNRLCIITADLISIPDAVYQRVLTYLMKEEVIDECSLCICASHTHSGPDVEESLIIASPTREYLEGLVKKMILAAKEAAGELRPVEIRISSGLARFSNKPAIGYYRKPWWIAGFWQLNSITRKHINRSRSCLELAATRSAWGMIICRSARITPGLPRFILKTISGLEAALFVNMTEGNIIPSTRPHYDSLDTRGYLGGTFEESKSVGESLGRSVIEALKRSRPPVNPELRSARRVITLKPAHADLGLWKAWKNLLKERRISSSTFRIFVKQHPLNLKPVYTLWRDASRVVIERNMDESEMRRLMSAVSRFLIMAMKLGNPSFRKPYPLSVQVIRLGDLRILTLPGEVLVEVGREWQRSKCPFRGGGFHISVFRTGLSGTYPIQIISKNPKQISNTKRS